MLHVASAATDGKRCSSSCPFSATRMRVHGGCQHSCMRRGRVILRWHVSRSPCTEHATTSCDSMCGLQTPDNSMATSSHPPASASMVASVTPQSTTPTVSSSERNSDSGAGAGASARLALPPGSGLTGQPSAPLSTDHSMAGEDRMRCDLHYVRDR